MISDKGGTSWRRGVAEHLFCQRLALCKVHKPLHNCPGASRRQHAILPKHPANDLQPQKGKVTLKAASRI